MSIVSVLTDRFGSVGDTQAKIATVSNWHKPDNRHDLED